MTDSSRALDKQLAAIERAVNQLASRAPALLERNERGGSAERDGWPAGGDNGGGSRSSDRTSSTERTVLERLADEESGRFERDAVNAAVKALRHHVDEAVKSLNNALSQVRLGEHLASHDGRHSNPPTPCLACDRIIECTTEDPSRGGFCQTCSRAWYRWKASEEAEGRSADRSRFCRTRKAEEAA